MEFSDYMERKFLEWQLEQGGRRSLSEFAAYVGVSPALMSYWLNGSRRPGAKNAELLAEIFGDEIYDILQMPRPDPDLQRIKRLWGELSPVARRALREQAERYRVNPPEEETPTAASQRSETLSRE